MIKYLFLLFLLLSVPISASSLSLRIENNFYTQHAIQWTFLNHLLLNQHIDYKVGYSTSRLNASRRNMLKKDNFTVSATWRFPNSLPITPYLQTDVGYTSYEIEDAAFSFLENFAWTAAVLIGSRIQVLNDFVGLEIELGYSLIQSSTVDPATFTIGVWYDF